MAIRALFDLYRLRRNLRLKPSRLEKMQEKNLRAIIKHAYQNVSFYHKKFDSVGIKPNDIQTVADLSKVPITTKSEIQRTSFEEIVAGNVDVTGCIKRTTSGSTGEPLTIVVDKRVVDFEEALWVRTFLENGLRIWDNMVVIADPRSFPHNRSWYQRIGVMRRNYISIFDDVHRKVALLEKYNPNVIKSYPSSLTILANACEKRKNVVKPRLVFTSAELLDNENRKLISSVFETELFDNYASYEFSLMAWECAEGIGYHMNIDNVAIEFINGGEVVAPGERGEVVCTSLINHAMPLIRYKMGDVGVLGDEQCPCGRTLPLMKILEGRVDDFLMALDGRVISPTVFFPYPFGDFDGIRQFKVIQDKRDKLTIQLVVREGFLNTPQVFENARKELQRLFGEGMHIEFQILDKIARDPSGKLRKVVSRIPVHIVRHSRNA